MSLKEKLNTYIKLEKEILDYFNYTDGIRMPIKDRTSKYWFVTGAKRGDSFCYSPEPFTKESIEAGDNIYSGAVFVQGIIARWIYGGTDYTMLCADTRTIMIFENAKELKDKDLIKQYIQTWGY